MNKFLSILVPYYNEGEEVIKPLLDSIAIQQNIDMNEIEVVICDDGPDAVLLSDFAKAVKGDKVVDLGTGTGIIPILMEQKVGIIGVNQRWKEMITVEASPQ